MTAALGTGARINVAPMRDEYNPEVGRLLAQAFQGKFRSRLHLPEDELAQGFTTLLAEVAPESFTERRVALQQGRVLGSISLKWRPLRRRAIAEAEQKPMSRNLHHPIHLLGNWNRMKLLIGLSVLEHEPQAGECYIADVAVASDQRGKGIGKLLLQWAQQVVEADPDLERLSLHVAANNPRARQLYERMSFQAHSRERRLASYLLFDEMNWDYMVQEKREVKRP